MAKKPNKAKRTTTASRRKVGAIPRDTNGQQFLFHPATGKLVAGEPVGGYRSKRVTAAEIEAAEKRLREWRQRAAAQQAAFQDMRRRHDRAKRRHTLPNAVRLFLERLYDEPSLWPEPKIDRDRVEQLLREVYVQGCTEGYIEGRVHGMERDRIVSQKRNDRKRQKNNLDDRDDAIAAEYRELCRMMRVGEARQRLAAKYERDPRTIYNVAKKAGLVQPRPHHGRKA